MKTNTYLLAVILLLAACGNKRNIPEGSGLIETTEVTFSPQSSGQLMTLHFDEGQNVRPGDTLAVIDTATVMLKLRQAKAAGDAAVSRLSLSGISIRQTTNSLDLAKKEFNRVEQLIKSGSANQQQYDQAQNTYRQAQLAKEQSETAQRSAQSDLDNANAQIALLEKQVSDCFPLSPVGGTIVDKYFEVGELVAAGRPLVKISRLDTVWVKIYLPPADLTRIKLGQHASIDPEDGHSKALDGIITWISSEAEFTPKNVQTKEARAGLLYAVKATIANPNQTLKIGMPVMVTVQ
jgi:HlyD family secretion protein